MLFTKFIGIVREDKDQITGIKSMRWLACYGKNFVMVVSVGS